MPRFSANLGFLWPDRPLLQRIEAASRAGFRAVELQWPYDVPAADVRAACARGGLTLLGVNTPVGNRPGDSGLGAIVGRESEFEAAFIQSLAYVRDMGGTAIHVMAGIIAPGDRQAARACFVENLRRCASAASDLTLLLEALNPRDRPGYLYSTIEDVVSVIEEVGAPNLKIMFDVYHVGVSQGDVLTRLERFMPLIGHIQVAAVPSRREPDEGEIAYPAIFQAIDRLGYAGWVGCEYRPRTTTDEGLRWVEELGVTL